MADLELALDTVPRIFFAEGFSSKKKALQTLASILAEQSDLALCDILEAFMNRERLGSTAIGNGIAIPHGRMENFSEAMGAIIIIENGIDFEAKDGAVVDVLFGLLVPDECCEQHLTLLQSIASIAVVPKALEMLKTEKSAEKIYQWIASNNQLLGDILR